METLSYPSPEHRNTEIDMISVFWDEYDIEESIKNFIIDYHNKTGAFNTDETFTLNDMDYVHKKLDKFWINYQYINWFKVENWVLITQDNLWKKEIYNLFLNEEKFLTIQENFKNNKSNLDQYLKENLDHLNQDLDKEIVLWGVVLSYAVSSRTWNYFIEKFSIQNWTWVDVIELSEDTLNNWSKLQLKDKIFKIFEKKWYAFNVSKWIFQKLDNIKNLTIKNTTEIISKIKNLDYKKYSDILNQNWDIPIDEINFNELKSSAINEINIEKWDFSISNLKKSLWKWLICMPLIEMIMYPTFFQEYHRNSSDLASIWIAFWEAWAFYSWMKVGQKIPWNIITKQLSWIAWWVAWIMWSEKLAKEMDLDKKFWQTSSDREDFWHKKWWEWKSVLTHILTAGAANDLMDKVWFDLKIPWTPLVFIQTKLNLNTNPQEYMQSAIWRDLDFWNQRVDLLKAELTQSIITLIQDYKNNTWDFDDLSTFSEDFIEFGTFWKLKPEVDTYQWVREKRKNKLFITELESLIFNNGVSEQFPEVQQQLYNILSENFTTDFYQNEWNINILVWNIVDKMKLDDFSLEKISDNLHKKNKNLNGLLQSEFDSVKDMENLEFDIKFKDLIKDTKHKIFINKLFQRIINKQQMLDSNITYPIWTRKTKDSQYYSDDFVPKLIEKSEDRILWEKLIQWKNWDLFVELLNYMVEYKRDKEFYEKITTTWYAVEWNKI